MTKKGFINVTSYVQSSCVIRKERSNLCVIRNYLIRYVYLVNIDFTFTIFTVTEAHQTNTLDKQTTH